MQSNWKALTFLNKDFDAICDKAQIERDPAIRNQLYRDANNKMMVTEVNTTGPTDENGAPMCNGTGETLPMAPGNWEFSAPLASGSATCVRNIQADGDLSIQLIDGVDGCSGPTAEPAAEGAPADGAAPAEGEAPADPAAPATG